MTFKPGDIVTYTVDGRHDWMVTNYTDPVYGTVSIHNMSADEEAVDVEIDVRSEQLEPNLRDRYYAWNAGMEMFNPDSGVEPEEVVAATKSLYAFDGNRDLICFDEYGYFYIKGFGPGEDPMEAGHQVDNVWKPVYPDGTVCEIPTHVEWTDVAGLYDEMGFEA